MARPKIATERILDAALSVFIKKGYHNTTITDICKEVSCPVGSIYYRFSGKQDIAVGVYDRVARQFQDGFVQFALQGPVDPAAGVQACVGHVLDFVETKPKEASFLLLLRHRDFLDSKEMRKFANRSVLLSNEKLYNWTRDLHTALQGRGSEGASYDLMLALVFDMPLGYARRWLQGQAKLGPREVRGEMLRAALGGLGLGVNA